VIKTSQEEENLLLNLHVKNLAIIDEIEVDFSEGMNVLTGETGAGKSIIIGSINMAIGGKVPKDIIRKGAGFALIELLFSVDTEEQRNYLEEHGIIVDNDEVLVSRKFTKGRGINRINGESVPVSVLKQAAAVLIDVHGQNEQQSLLYKAKHMEILDRYAREDMSGMDTMYTEVYNNYKKLIEQRDLENIPEEERLREISFMQYELEEIENAALVHGEEESLEDTYKQLSNAASIVNGLGEIYSLTGSDANDTVSEKLAYSLRIIGKLCEYDDNINQFAEQLSEIDSLVSDFNRDIVSYLDDIETSGELLEETEKRLDLVRKIKARFGATTELVNEYADKLRSKLERYSEYEEYKAGLDKKIKEEEAKLKKLAISMSEVRKKCAKVLEKEIAEALADLNFLQVQFSIEVRNLDEYTAHGTDEIEFMLSANPGEDLKPIGMAASGGELSRIMLAVKAVLAGHDEISTLIFDEIDVGISGRTAQMVAEKMALIARQHQVICISHLAQIAAMADAHYLIEKINSDLHTSTQIRLLGSGEEAEELARILGGAQITEAVMNSAEEMKRLAANLKKEMK
jgi:DNA repair protein RecN (Recombination protein N)